MKLEGDFTGGGAYVSANRGLEEFGMIDVSAIKLRYRAENLSRIAVRLGDGTGQTHQKGHIPVISDGEWHELVIEPSKIAGGEHWGGANDGKWHAAPKYFSLVIGKPSGDARSVALWFADVRAEAVMPGHTGAPAWTENFESAGDQAKDWIMEGTASLRSEEAFKGDTCLALEKSDATLRDPVSATGPSFPVTPGPWQIAFATRTDLTSMDNSYRGALEIEFLDGSGRVMSKEILTEPYSKSPWKAGSKQVEIPQGASAARFAARIHKETPGTFRIDELAAAPMKVERRDDRIKRLMFTASELGHLLFPESSRDVRIELWASKPLPAEQRQVHCEVRDYWGAEQAAPIAVEVKRTGKKNNLFVYEGSVDLAQVPMEIGRYYELHGRIDREGSDPFTYYTSLAILPEAPANAYAPEDIPWTSRNWDNRIAEYVRLTHRLGIRICGLWGRVTPDNPPKTSAPQIKLVEELGMGWLTGSPAHSVEQGKDLDKWTEEALRAGIRKLIEDYGHVRPMIVNLGNEPHGKGEKVKEDVAAYRAVYSEIKAIDPSIYVVGTSVGASDEYFAAGMGEWCDAYDFHVYESADNVRRIIEETYPALFEKYGHAKPIWSTELGLNSQGIARQQVAGELFKKTVGFFAGGGANMSWFGLLYPDSEGKSADSFGSAHNVFDCRYNKYAPKLDAIAYYNMVNSLLTKKYVTDTIYGEDIHAFLFRDAEDRAMQVWYKGKGREDLFIALPGVRDVQVIRIDGSRSELDAGGKGVTLTVNTDPFLLLYEGGEKSLPEQLGDPAIRLGAVADAIVRGEPSSFDVELVAAQADRVKLQAPPFWTVQSQPARNADGRDIVRFTLGVPAASSIREADMTIILTDANGKANGEISYRPAVTGTVSLELLPTAADEKQPPALQLTIRNNSPSKQRVTWDVMLTGEQELKEAKFTAVSPSDAYFTDTQSGSLELEGHQAHTTILPMADADLYKVYRVRASVRDSANRVTTVERPVAAFYCVPRAAKQPVLDGKLDEAIWKSAHVRTLDNADQFYAFTHLGPVQTWEGPNDLSADIQFAWDDEHLYLGVDVTDDKVGPLQQDSNMWLQDGLQFLVDPMRTSAHKVGKYDYSLGIGKKGPQTWCHLSADAGAPTGEAADIRIATQKVSEGTADMVYEIAIPWHRLAPFKPDVGENLGFTLIVNEDDGNNRDSFMTWFGNAHNKDVDTVGDLILME